MELIHVRNELGARATLLLTEVHEPQELCLDECLAHALCLEFGRGERPHERAEYGVAPAHEWLCVSVHYESQAFLVVILSSDDDKAHD